MSAKKWCALALTAVIVVFCAVGAFNAAIDPFGVFGDVFLDWYSYDMTNNPRAAKTAYLEKNGEKYDSFIVGCSSSSSFPVESLNKALDANFYNLIMYGADMADCEKTVKYLLENHTVKNIFLNVYMGNAVNYDFCGDELTEGLHCKVSGENPIKFYGRCLFANPLYSFEKLKAKLFKDEYFNLSFDVFNVETGAYDKRKRDAEAISSLEEYYESYPVFANYPRNSYSMPHIYDNAASVAEIKRMCDNAGVNLIVATAPVYYDYFSGFSKEDVAEFYCSLAKAAGGFWDFAVSDVSLEPRYFYDETHFRNSVGEMAVARMFENPKDIYIPENFGAFVTEQNFSERVDSFYNLEFSPESYSKKISVFLWHHIDENITSSSVVTPKTFESQLSALKSAGYESVSLKDIENYIYKGINLPEKCVLLTFDDGYKSNLEKAYPILEKYGYCAVVFEVGAMVGKSFYKNTDFPAIEHLSADDNEFLIRGGIVEIQSHSFDCHQVAEYESGETVYSDMLKKSDETDGEYVERIKRDFEQTEKALGFSPCAVAFPHGLGDLLAQAALNECGVKFTFTTEYKSSTLVKGLPQSGYMLGRYSVYESTAGEDMVYFASLSQ